ncbi:MAG TPA: MBL fold metallo-hydrolase [Pseudomonadales bacterium]|jgi:glyoxylase-like metal-dependent hydrolase (beta-lactamase superfamily II)
MSERPAMLFKTFPVGPLQCNCCIIADPVTRKAVVIDPGGDAERILATLKADNLTLVSIVHTHAHLDHILAAGELKEATGAPIKLHKEDQFLWDSVEWQCQAFGVPYTPLPPPDGWLEDDEPLACCGGKARHTPGHTPGSVSFVFEDHKLLVAGDTLFRRSIGRTDLPGGDYEQIARSILDKLYSLDEDTEVITGHGPSTTIGEEIRENPFVRG